MDMLWQSTGLIQGRFPVATDQIWLGKGGVGFCEKVLGRRGKRRSVQNEDRAPSSG